MAEWIRKWGIQFDGQDDPLFFVELLEVRTLSYGVDINCLPRAMAELLTDRANRWFRTSQLQTASWTDFRQDRVPSGPSSVRTEFRQDRVPSGPSSVRTEFRQEFLAFFLPPRYFEQLEDQIKDRKQAVGEPFKDFTIELRLLMHHAGYDAAKELSRIYDNTPHRTSYTCEDTNYEAQHNARYWPRNTKVYRSGIS
ncbi:uncharacterized protein LOC117191871 [Drosophila miranda]|uniref:uncharacterized protein LOC117191871 n=1 Tax=Drosophila miranda TaxID=7229 RepID=UPI00143F463C|nr:uncharacterized protein LOC117191871 [Drosophila miranda]